MATMRKGKGPRIAKRKFCKLCLDRVTFIDYKDERKLQRFLTDHGKIVPRRVSGSCTKHQAQITRAIKRARVLALLPYTNDQLR